VHDPIDGGQALEAAKARDRVDIESAARFRFFFVALVFGILSFAIQFPVKTQSVCLKTLEALSWGLVAVTGLLGLIDIGAFSLTTEAQGRLARHGRIAMWAAFVGGIILLLAAKVSGSFQS
jgi:hypothetical protein